MITQVGPMSKLCKCSEYLKRIKETFQVWRVHLEFEVSVHKEKGCHLFKVSLFIKLDLFKKLCHTEVLL